MSDGDQPTPPDEPTTSREDERAAEETAEHAPAAARPVEATTDAVHDPPPSRATETFDHTVTHGEPGDGAGRAFSRGTTVRYFGDYEIQRELGRGGMGVVYKARQVSLNRPVALKMIKAGVLAGVDELRRFKNEAEAVAMLDHPGIVSVHEVGEHEGQQYFSMKLVEGSNLGERLREFEDRPRDAARLVAEAAEAVAHAHMRGILHRDLKPANLLVDAEGHPHITDFGLAKRVEADEEMTTSGAILGTPAYMSPEQAEGRRGTITTATDVYGLGAILYALLTGRAPFKGDSVVDTLAKVRAQPPEGPRKLNAKVPRVLETICLKCLEKDPRRRYPTANALADDLHRWLDSRPITARRAGAAERAWLWCKRKPAIAALSAAMFLALAGGTGATIAVQARANASLAEKNDQLLRANTALKDEQRKVEDREREALDALDRFGRAIADEPLLKNTPFLKELRSRLLREPLAFFGRLQSQLAVDALSRPDSLQRLASVAYRHGRLAHEIGDRQDALKSLQLAATALTRIIREHPSEPEYQLELANTNYATALVQAAMGGFQKAIGSVEQAERILERGTGSPFEDGDWKWSLARCQLMHGTLLFQAGQVGASRRSLDNARRVYEVLIQHHGADLTLRSEFAKCLLCLGGIATDSGQFDEARAHYADTMRVLDELAKAEPSVADFRCDMAKVHHNLGKIESLSRRFAEARVSFQRSIELFEELTREQPTVIEYQTGLAGGFLSLSQADALSGRPDECAASLSKARPIFELLVREHPESPDFASALGATLHNLGEYHFDARRYDQARVLLKEAIGLQSKALETNPSNQHYRECMEAHLLVLRNVARATRDAADLAQAESGLAELEASDARLKKLRERLRAVLGGEFPKDHQQCIALAREGYRVGMYAASARLWREAIESEPNLAADRQTQHRYNAACAAALAAAGTGKDEPPLDDASKSMLREQAREWLQEELDVWTKLIDSATPEQRTAIVQTLKHWQQDTDLATIRDADALARLPEAERQAWKTLWTHVDALLAKRAETASQARQ